ncbi:MAG: HlyD family efflux transporter periplasmic adaptor subunit [Tahibacter sp.]
MRNCLLIALSLTLLAGCQRSRAPEPLLGTLEWDRIGIAAEASEPIVAIRVKEGDTVEAGQALLDLDPRRLDAQIAAAQAEFARSEAALAELAHGARSETIAAARAELARTGAAVTDAARERDRAADLRRRALNAQVDLDRADTALKTARAQAAATSAQLQELLNGTRPEQVDQASAAVEAAKARVSGLSLNRERLSLRAPVAGRIDALVFKLGDQPPLGATLVSLLSGSAPYARVYVPQPRRTALDIGQHFQVRIAGNDTPYEATLRSIRSEASFTPYYALSGDDASRLSYRAELLLSGAAAQKLPAGLPVQATVSVDGR